MRLTTKLIHHGRWLMCLFSTLALLACEQSNRDSTQHELEKQSAPITAAADYPFIDWSALMPSDWDAMALLKDIDLENMDDNDPKAFALLTKVREQWNNAPVVNSLDGKKVTMNGYIVPLDGDADFINTFLLVPYFGACIHSPPPPSNQVIYVQVPGKGLPLNEWEAFALVSGVLKVTQTTSGLGVAGYQMQADIVKPTAEAAF
jgi:uncharacterized protein